MHLRHDGGTAPEGLGMIAVALILLPIAIWGVLVAFDNRGRV